MLRVGRAAQAVLIVPFGISCETWKRCTLIVTSLAISTATKVSPASRGGKRGKRRAVVAVARKLAVLLHHLWLTGEVYEPLYQGAREKAA